VPKRAIATATVTTTGIEGDLHAHPAIHGGPLKALLLISSEGIEELKQAGFPLYWGALGENLTTQGMDRRGMRIGQRWRIGEIVVELTRVRTPCETLAPYGSGIQSAVYDAQVKAGDATSPRWGLSGFYAAVVKTGIVRTGDPIELLAQMV